MNAQIRHTAFFLIILLVGTARQVHAADQILVEAESFSDQGGWVVDPQFVEQMGSPYLMAHGLGDPVANAVTTVRLEEAGTFHVWARTKDWVPGKWEAPGRFKILVNGEALPNILGVTPGWGWEYAGQTDIRGRQAKLELADLTGFNGRCDAVFLSQSPEAPPASAQALATWRKTTLQEPPAPPTVKQHDLVIVGGGLAGCAAAIAAGEEGLKVALIHDRPLLGGNASSEIRVHTLGIYGKFERILRMIDTEHYPNGDPKAAEDQKKRDRNVKRQPNIDLYLNHRAYNAVAQDNVIQYVDARETSTGKRIRFRSPLFIDSTGDGWIGYWAGAEYSYGRESVDTYGEAWDKWGELWSPEEGDNFVMGSSVLWRTKVEETYQEFPKVLWAADVAQDHKAIAGEWYWELSRNDLHQIDDGEELRDHMLRAIFGSFANAKQEHENACYGLQWVSYLLGKRESRRLVGDHIFTFRDVTEQIKFPDAVVQEKREIDVHFQQNLQDEKKPDFLSTALFYKTPMYYIPYRSLYSKNIENLFMAGRCFSCSHVGLGGPRVMRTTGQMGAAVGFAASLCKKYQVNPRDIYRQHLPEYLELIESQQVRGGQRAN